MCYLRTGLCIVLCFTSSLHHVDVIIAQPYWWNELETSSPAKAMKKAALLYDVIQNGLRGDHEGDGQGQNQDEGSEPHPEAQNLAGSIEAITVESAEALSARFQLREVVLSGDKSSLKSTGNQDQLHVKIPIYHKPILRRISNR